MGARAWVERSGPRPQLFRFSIRPVLPGQQEDLQQHASQANNCVARLWPRSAVSLLLLRSTQSGALSELVSHGIVLFASPAQGDGVACNVASDADSAATAGVCNSATVECH